VTIRNQYLYGEPDDEYSEDEITKDQYWTQMDNFDINEAKTRPLTTFDNNRLKQKH